MFFYSCVKMAGFLSYYVEIFSMLYDVGKCAVLVR